MGTKSKEESRAFVVMTLKELYVKYSKEQMNIPKSWLIKRILQKNGEAANSNYISERQKQAEAEEAKEKAIAGRTVNSVFTAPAEAIRRSNEAVENAQEEDYSPEAEETNQIDPNQEQEERQKAGQELTGTLENIAKQKEAEEKHKSNHQRAKILQRLKKLTQMYCPKKKLKHFCILKLKNPQKLFAIIMNLQTI